MTANTLRNENPTFTQIPDTVIYDCNLNPFAGWLYVVIMSYTRKDNPTAFPSLKTLARQTGMSKNAVIDYLRILKEKGLIDIKARFTDDGDSDSNLYIVKDANKIDPDNKIMTIKDARERLEGGNPDELPVVHDDDYGGNPDEPEIEPSKNNQSLKIEKIPAFAPKAKLTINVIDDVPEPEREREEVIPSKPEKTFLEEMVDILTGGGVRGMHIKRNQNRLQALIDKHGEPLVKAAVEMSIAEDANSMVYLETKMSRYLHTLQPKHNQIVPFPDQTPPNPVQSSGIVNNDAGFDVPTKPQFPETRFTRTQEPVSLPATEKESPKVITEHVTPYMKERWNAFEVVLRQDWRGNYDRWSTDMYFVDMYIDENDTLTFVVTCTYFTKLQMDGMQWWRHTAIKLLDQLCMKAYADDEAKAIQDRYKDYRNKCQIQFIPVNEWQVMYDNAQEAG